MNTRPDDRRSNAPSPPIARNIVALPPSEVTDLTVALSEQLSREFACEFVLGQENLPHISIYQTTYPPDNEFLMIERVREVATGHKPLEIVMDKVAPLLSNTQSQWSTLLFWDAIRSSALTALHESLIQSLGRLRSQKLLPIHQELLDDPELPPGLKNSLRLHGTLLAGHAERPHITLTRLKSISDVVAAQQYAEKQLPKPGDIAFTVQTLYITEVGPHGTCPKILHEIPLHQE